MNPIDRWYRRAREQGQSAVFEGFSDEIRNNETLEPVFDDMDLSDRIELFDFICRLIEEARGMK
jgi:hypothetical protein